MDQSIPAYEVISTQDSQMRNQMGLSVPSKMINIRFADGTHSHVEVPAVAGWSQQAQAEIEALYEEHLAVMGIKGPPVQVQQRRPGIPYASRS